MQQVAVVAVHLFGRLVVVLGLRLRHWLAQLVLAEHGLLPAVAGYRLAADSGRSVPVLQLAVLMRVFLSALCLSVVCLGLDPVEDVRYTDCVFLLVDVGFFVPLLYDAVGRRIRCQSGLMTRLPVLVRTFC